MKETENPDSVRYGGNWESLGNYSVPEWYKDGKFGIWPHWGVYSVPAHRGNHAAEWYGRWMYATDENTDPRGIDKARFHHYEKYGDPGTFGYKDFIPRFTAEKWDPGEWARMACDAGAKFFCMMGTHHDSFALYESKYTRWNSLRMGPKRDLVREMAQAARRAGLKFGLSNHLAWNAEFFRFNHENRFDAIDPELHDLYSEGKFDTPYLERWWKRTTEMVDLFMPDLYYFDWGWNAEAFAPYRPKFASYYYNRAIESGKGRFSDPGVVLNYKNESMPSGCGVLDLERESLDSIREMTWQTDTSISRHSWGYCDDDEYRTGKELIHTLVDVVSKNGVLMLNFGPKADGSVGDEYRKPLEEIGSWLKVCGDAIYNTRPYKIFGEGEGERDPERGHSDEISFNSHVTRFTRSKDEGTLYAIILGWPGRRKTIKTLNRTHFGGRTVQSVGMIGTGEALTWKIDDEGLHVDMPEAPPCEHAFALEIGLIPAAPSCTPLANIRSLS